MQKRVIDIFKIDTEGAEVGVLKTFDMDYACKHIKQLVGESHSFALLGSNPFKLLSRLEKRFSLFHRDMRFAYSEGDLFQDGALIKTKNYGTETYLSQFMMSYGELYFININFV